MSRARFLLSIALSLLIFTFLSPDGSAEGGQCSVGGTEYASLNEAVTAVAQGEATGKIQLLADCQLDVGTIGAPIVIDGGGHSVTIPVQSGSDSGSLLLNSSLSFMDTHISFSNPSNWSLVMGGSGRLALLSGSNCGFEKCGIYASPGAEIKVNDSRLTLENMAYTCMMAESYATLTVENGSEFLISHPVNINGITSFYITVDSSLFAVKDCRRQGLVNCSLTLKNGSMADISGNGYGYNLYSYNALVVEDSARLTMNGNSTAAILMQGYSTVLIKNGGFFECSSNGGGWTAQQPDAIYGSKAAIDVGWLNASHVYSTGNFTVEDGAEAIISGNYSRALSNYGTVYLGSGCQLCNNGALTEGGNASQRRIERGGGIYNAGTLTLAQGTAIYKNHASLAGDDVENAATASVTLPATGKGWKLDYIEDTNDCGDIITGWFMDRDENRWNAHHGASLTVQELAPGTYDGELSLKAAHGISVPPEMGDDASLLPPVIGGLLTLVILAFCVKRLSPVKKRQTSRHRGDYLISD